MAERSLRATPEGIQKAKKAFKDQGFKVLTVDKEIFTLTASKALAGEEDVIVNALVNQGGNTQITLTGSFGNDVQASSESAKAKIINTTDKNSTSKRAFDAMHEVALSYKGAKVLYGTD